MSGTSRIDGSSPKLVDQDPAELEEARLKAEYEASKKKPFCDEHPDKIPCATAPKDKTADGTSYTDISRNMRVPKPAPSPVPNPRDQWQSEAEALAKKLEANPEPYAGKKDDQARLAELQTKLAPAPQSDVLAIPQTNDAGRKSTVEDGLLKGTAGHDGASVYAGGAIYKTTGKDDKVEVGDASVQVGVSTELQITSVRITQKTSDGNITIEGPAAKYTAGWGRNDDGSIGYHAGGSAQVAAVQGTKNYANGSITGGLSEGVGVSGSIGTKTMPNGDTAACVQASALFFSAGFCWTGRM